MSATTNTGSDIAPERELSAGGIFKGAGAGAAVGALANAALYFIGSAAGVSMTAEFAKGQPVVPLAAGQVVVASFVPAIGAALLALLLNRISTRPSRIFVGIAIGFGVLSMGGPFSVPEASIGLRLVLAAMHIISGIAITAGIIRLGKRT